MSANDWEKKKKWRKMIKRRRESRTSLSGEGWACGVGLWLFPSTTGPGTRKKGSDCRGKEGPSLDEGEFQKKAKVKKKKDDSLEDF